MSRIFRNVLFGSCPMEKSLPNRLPDLKLYGKTTKETSKHHCLIAPPCPCLLLKTLFAPIVAARIDHANALLSLLAPSRFISWTQCLNSVGRCQNLASTFLAYRCYVFHDPDASFLFFPRHHLPRFRYCLFL